MKRKYNKFIIPFLILLLYLLPLLILQENSHIRIQDNLDSSIVWLKIISESGKIFSPPLSTIPNIMNGIPRSSLPSGLYIPVWLFSMFSPMTAYIINLIIIRIVAFVGLYLLLKKHVLKDSTYSETISIGVALCFSLLPFWSPTGISIAGQPLLFYAFLNVRQARKIAIKDWLVILFFPLYSTFAGAGIFLLFVLLLIFIHDWVKCKKMNYYFPSAILLLAVSYIATNYMLFYMAFILKPFVSHRTAFAFPPHDILGSLRFAIGNLIVGQRHAQSVHFPIIFLSVIMAVVTSHVTKQKIRRLFLIILYAIIAIALFFGFYYWFVFFLRSIIPIIISFKFSRIHWLHPLLWYILFALSLATLSKRIKTYGKKLAIFLIVAQIFILFSFHNEIIYRDKPTFNEFFSENLFNDIKLFIGDPPASYRVVAIGIYPSILQYNGFYTLDGYIGYYPLEYKKKFRRIIQRELEKNEEIKDYFDNWGSKAYIFTDELGKNFEVMKEHNLTITNLSLNTLALQEMGGDYIISAVRIINEKENGLTLLRTFTDENSPYKIYLYKVLNYTPA
jgi:hypothetical protein